MDMAVASLFKHKIRFTFEVVYTEIYEPRCFRRTHYYESPTIENVESIGLNDVNDLCTILCKPLVLYAFSKIVHEDHVIPIYEVIITVGVADFQEGVDCNLQCYRFENPLGYPELFFTHADVDSCSFPERLLKERTHIFVNVYCYYYCESLEEEARFRREFNYNVYWHHALSVEEYLETTNSDNEILDEEVYVLEEEYTPPTETYREDRCVICLESKPNILYLYCMHISVCDSCDRLKEARRYKCDVCRSGVFERVKL